MKVSTALFTLGLALGVVSEPIRVQRDLDAFKAIFTEIDGKVDSLSSAINGGDQDNIISAGEDLVATINKGVETANAQDPLSLTEALGLTTPVQALTKKVEGAISQVIDAKEDFVAAGFAFTIKQNLDDQFAASNDLTGAVSSKVSDGVKEIAKQLAAGISNAIQKGIDAYKDVTDDGGSTPTDEPTGTAEPTAEPTGEPTGEPTAELTGEPTGEPTGGYPTPPPASTPSGGVPTSGPTPPPEWEGAAAINGQSIAGVIAAAAVVLAF
ncbi:hypothetical protein RJZ56_005902 [Blastomyces dermatitidis]